MLVAATVSGKLKGGDLAWGRNTSNATVVLYQRVDPSAPHYSPNLAYEAGVHIQFIAEYYDDLPNQTVFLQEGITHHNAHFVPWLKCLRPEAHYTPNTRSPSFGGLPLVIVSTIPKISVFADQNFFCL